jgi:hypothetical protein
MKVISLLILLFFISDLPAQIQSAKFYAGYSSPVSKRISVNEISAVGGGLEIQVKVYDFLSVSIAGGYDLYSLQQDNAIAQWNWRFWEQRYRGIVRADTAADPSLKASLNPVQKMDVVPLMLNINGSFEVFNNFIIRPSVGAGVYFYTRRMYLHEYWEKQFTASDYTFEYNYRNFAQDKTGNPFFLTSGISFDYQLAEYLSLSTSFNYIKMAKTPDEYGYSEFPFEDALNIKFGLNFLY